MVNLKVDVKSKCEQILFVGKTNRLRIMSNCRLLVNRQKRGSTHMMLLTPTAFLNVMVADSETLVLKPSYETKD